MADPRTMDLTLEPNGRPGPNWCFLGNPKMVNNGPVGVARFCTLRSWLSQWSYDDSNADACTHLARISVPVMVRALRVEMRGQQSERASPTVLTARSRPA